MSECDSICAAEEKPEVEYREIPQYPGYMFGSDGSAWSSMTRSGQGKWTPGGPWKRLAVYTRKASGGGSYRKVYVCVHCKNKLLARIVLEAFVGPCPSNHECCHINGDSTDNRLANLRWGTKESNQSDKVRHGTILHGESHPLSYLTETEVREIRKRYSAGENCVGLANEFGVSHCVMWQIASGRSWKYTR